MKNVFLVLLFLVLGAAAFFYFSKKKSNARNNYSDLIIGKWGIDNVNNSKSKDSNSVFAVLLLKPDSNRQELAFHFLKNGMILDSNSKKIDTSFYAIEKQNNLFVWTKNDHSKSKLSIRKLDSLKLVVQDKDSTVFSFRRI